MQRNAPIFRHAASLATAAALLAASSVAHAVVESGHWSYGPLVNGARNISVEQRPDGTNWYGVQTAYDAQAGTLTLGIPTLGAPADLFVVAAGQVVGLDNWQALSAQRSPLQVGQDFYLGAATIAVSDPEFNGATVNTTRTSFGWAHFQAQTDGTLKMLGSAMAFREGGIVVGTLQAVPEPGTWALMGLGLLGVAAARRQARPGRAA